MKGWGSSVPKGQLSNDTETWRKHNEYANKKRKDLHSQAQFCLFWLLMSVTVDGSFEIRDQLTSWGRYRSFTLYVPGGDRRISEPATDVMLTQLS